MSLNLPTWIDEMIDPNDPLAILLAKEGSNDEAYQTAQQYRSGTVQVVLHSEIEHITEETDGDWIRKTRRLSSKTTIVRGPKK